MPRLAMCHVCATLTRLPDPPEKAPLVPARWEWEDERGHREEFTFRDESGQPVMVAQYDPALEDWVERHLHQDIPETTRKHDIWGVDDLTWQTTDVVSTVKRDMLEQTGKFYTERDELKDDALACFEKHGRPKDSCPDVFSDAKLIGGHESNRRMRPDDRLFLCHLCPFVHGYVVPTIRRKKGMDR